MGIHGLTKLLSDEAPNCMKEVDLDSLTGRKVAVDASMAMYQFLVRHQYVGVVLPNVRSSVGCGMLFQCPPRF